MLKVNSVYLSILSTMLIYLDSCIHFSYILECNFDSTEKICTKPSVLFLLTQIPLDSLKETIDNIC